MKEKKKLVDNATNQWVDPGVGNGGVLNVERLSAIHFYTLDVKKKLVDNATNQWVDPGWEMEGFYT